MNATKWSVGVGLAGAVLSLTVASAAPMKPIKILIQAESAVEVQQPLRRVVKPERDARSGAKKGAITSSGYLEMPSVTNHREGTASYRFQVVTPGSYWVRARVRYLDKGGNYLHVAFNGKAKSALGFDSTLGMWHWVGGRLRVRCVRGINTLVLSNVGVGVQVDQILLTTEHDNSGPISRRPIPPRR